MNAIALKIGAGVVGAGLLWLLVSMILGWRHKATIELPAARQATADMKLAYTNFRKESARENTRLAALSESFETEVEGLRVNARRVPVMRLCPQPALASATGRADPPAPTAPDDPAPTARSVPGVPGRDIGSELAGLLDQADRLSAQTRGLQAYVAGLPPQCLANPVPVLTP